ncbi:MAG: KH domain-containing protein [Armatimonadota bacterium]
MKEIIEYLVKEIVDQPEKVQIRETESDGVVNLEVVVSQSDIGKVIGRQGRIANDLRTVAKIAATKQKKRVFLDIVA